MPVHLLSFQLYYIRWTMKNQKFPQEAVQTLESMDLNTIAAVLEVLWGFLLSSVFMKVRSMNPPVRGTELESHLVPNETEQFLP